MKEAHADHQKYIEEGFRGGNEAHIRELYENHTPQLLRWIQNNNGTAADAQEIFQDSMYALLVKANDPNFVLTCPIGAFLYSIWYNKWMSKLRIRKRGQELQVDHLALHWEHAPVQAVAEEILSEVDCFKMLDRTFQDLSERCRQLLALSKAGKTVPEIREILQMNQDSTVHRRRHACISRWQDLLQGAPEFEDCKMLLT